MLAGVAGVLWPSTALPSFWQAVSARAVSARILADERFRPGVLDQVLSRIEAEPQVARPQPDQVRAEALIRLRAAEEASQRKSPQEADRELGTAEDRLRSSLVLNPADSFLWLMLYRVENDRSGFDASNVRYLDQSYATGPREGWIALRRNRLALAIFPLLDEALQRKVVSEFASMVDSELTEEAALNLTGVGWSHRAKLLASLERVDIIPREAFAKRLARDGVKATVPGVDIPERIWR
jgi:hypothetical protein